MRRILFVFPTAWDERQLRNSEEDWQKRYEVHFAEPSDVDCPANFDVGAWLDDVERRWKGKIDGVLSSSDYPGATLAAAAAERLGLPGPAPATVLGCSHKYASRQVQRMAAPEATPGFWLVDATRPGDVPEDLPWPCFTKPVKGAYSVHARRVDSPEDLSAFLATPPVQEFVGEYLQLFNDMVRRFTRLESDGRHFIVEELLKGTQVTVEGYATAQKVHVLGVVDSVMYPNTNSFMRFDYPSRLPGSVTARMEDVVRRVVKKMELSWCMFNAELIYDPEADRIAILEVNPRLCGQFSDLYRKVDGTGGYFMAMALACGRRPRRIARAGRYAVAASHPLRVFEPSRVERAPDEAALRAAEAVHPGTLVWSECQAGDELHDFARHEDGHSARYGIVNAGASDLETLLGKLEEVKQALGYRFAPLA